MRPVPTPSATAWTPWLRGERQWLLDRNILAAAWLAEKAAADRSPIIVQGDSHADGYRRADGPLGALARAGRVATYKSPVGVGATFVDQPDIKLLATAMSAANGHALCVTEPPTLPLDGWAMATGATNLATNEPTPDTRTDDQKHLLRTFIRQLYNGWSHKQVGRIASAHYLPLLDESGMTYTVFLGSLLAEAPAYLDSLDDIKEMKRALPAHWTAEAAELANFDWFRKT